jgi:hypothetical protein
MLRRIALLLFAAILVLLSGITLCGERRRSSVDSLAPTGALHVFKTSESWISVRSKHVLLIGNASERELRQIALRLEQFREVVSQLFQNVSVESPVPTTIIVFKDDASYGPFKRSDNNAGYFQPGQDVNYITLGGDTGVNRILAASSFMNMLTCSSTILSEVCLPGSMRDSRNCVVR